MSTEIKANKPKRDGAHKELDEFEPSNIDGKFISGIDDPVDIVPVFQNIAAVGRGDFLTKGKMVHALSLENAINHAEVLDSCLPREVLEIAGSSSVKIKHFLNNLMGTVTQNSSNNLKTYLEVGCHEGSTFIASCFQNQELIKEAYVIDKFIHGDSEKVEETFRENCVKFLGKPPANLFSEDCFEVDLQKIKEKVDVYLFDGPHGVMDHEKALTYYEPVFNDKLIVIIDDWNDHRVKLGTLRGLAKINYEVEWFHQMNAHSLVSDWGWTNIARGRLSCDTIPSLSGVGDQCRWWNGMMALVLKKKSIGV